MQYKTENKVNALVLSFYYIDIQIFRTYPFSLALWGLRD